MSDMNVFRTGTAVVSSSEGKSDPSEKLKDPEIGKCSQNPSASLYVDPNTM